MCLDLTPCCDVRYDLHIITMFGSSLPPVVCRRAHVQFMLFVCFFEHSSVHHILCCVFPFVCLRPVSCVPSVASCPFTIASSFSLTFIYLILCSYCLAMVRRRNMIIFVVYFIISNKFFNLLSNHKP
jgi:hypothetical protein